MYTVAVQRDFISGHFLVGGDWGAENKPHAHHYVVEVRLDREEF
jgi:6-pyruvoyltetrahydropterin/6-carboxytetrahydropterin synthase